MTCFRVGASSGISTLACLSLGRFTPSGFLLRSCIVRVRCFRCDLVSRVAVKEPSVFRRGLGESVASRVLLEVRILLREYIVHQLPCGGLPGLRLCHSSRRSLKHLPGISRGMNAPDGRVIRPSMLRLHFLFNVVRCDLTVATENAPGKSQK